MKIKAILEGMDPPEPGYGYGPPPSHGVVPYRGSRFPFDRLVPRANFLVEPEPGEKILVIQRKVSSAAVRFCRAKCRVRLGIRIVTRQVIEHDVRYVMVYREA